MQSLPDGGARLKHQIENITKQIEQLDIMISNRASNKYCDMGMLNTMHIVMPIGVCVYVYGCVCVYVQILSRSPYDVMPNILCIMLLAGQDMQFLLVFIFSSEPSVYIYI